MKEKESIISKQERAARQQELLERKRRAKAEFNTSDTRQTKKGSNRTAGNTGLDKPVFQNRKKAEALTTPVSERVDKKTVAGQAKRYQSGRTGERVSVSQWFVSICWLKIPFIGFIYAVILALRGNTPADKKNFARGYLLYRILVLALSLTVLYVLYQTGLSFIEELLSFVR